MSGPTRYHAAPGPKKDGSYIVMLKERRDKGRVLRWLDVDYEAEPNVKVVHRYNESNLIHGFSVNLTETALAAVLAHDDVEAVHEDAITTVYGERSITQDENVPWGLHRISHPGPAQHPFIYVYPENAGAGVKVYVLDTGIFIAHAEFEGRATYGKTFLATGLPGAGEDPDDKEGHGTHVAGTVIAKTYGVAKKANAIAVKVLPDSGGGAVSDAIAGIDWVVAQFEANPTPSLMNMSFGSDVSQPLDQAVNNAVERGVLVVVSAGNDGKDASLSSPAGAERAFTVGAIELNSDKRPDWSNFGSAVNIYAPGTGITSCGINGDYFDYRTGTSHSAPHVTGTFAISMSVEPGDPSVNLRPDKSQDDLPVIQMITV